MRQYRSCLNPVTFALMALTWVVLIAATVSVVKVAHADHGFCYGARQPWVTGSVDVQAVSLGNGVTQANLTAALSKWNMIWRAEYASRDAFTQVSTGGDVRVQAEAGSTHVSRPDWCAPSSPTNLCTVHLGADDAYRNATWITHELGHCLGLADHCLPDDCSAGHVNPGQEYGSYVGIMNYATPQFAWLRPNVCCVPGLWFDRDMIRTYYYCTDVWWRSAWGCNWWQP